MIQWCIIYIILIYTHVWRNHRKHRPNGCCQSCNKKEQSNTLSQNTNFVNTNTIWIESMQKECHDKLHDLCQEIGKWNGPGTTSLFHKNNYVVPLRLHICITLYYCASGTTATLCLPYNYTYIYIYMLEGPPCTMWRPCSFPYFLYFLLETSS